MIERSVILCDAQNLVIDENWMGGAAGTRIAPLQRLTEKLASQEKELIEAALAESRGKVYGPSGAAAGLGIPQSTLDSKTKSLKIDKNRFKRS